MAVQFLMLLGEYEYEELERVDPLWALIYFMIFQFLNFFVMLNVFLAILNDSYPAQLWRNSAQFCAVLRDSAQFCAVLRNSARFRAIL